MESTNPSGMMPLNLQLSGGGEESSQQAGAGPSPDAAVTGSGEQGGQEASVRPADLNALLTGDKALQSQFDRLVAKAIHTAVSNAKAKWEQEQDMTPEQRAAAQKREMDDALARREQAIAARELRAEALSLLGERGLPPELIDCVAHSNQEAMEASLNRAEAAFRMAVDKAVQGKLAGAAPKSGQGTASAQNVFQAKIDKYAQRAGH